MAGLIFTNILTLACRLNTKLESAGHPPMTSLVKDLSDGVRLIQLMVSTKPSPSAWLGALIKTGRKSWVGPPWHAIISCTNKSVR